MLVLAADTSLPLLSVALVRDAVLIGALALEGRGSRNEKLLPSVDWLLGENGVERSAIDLLAVTRGPGSFTGVRIGLATVQGLALALGRPVCAMSTHEAIAWGEPGRVAVVDDAGRGELYLSVWEDGEQRVAPRLASGDATGERIVHVSDVLQAQNVAVRCARRALVIEGRGEGDRYRDITPLYVRLPEAEARLQQPQG